MRASTPFRGRHGSRSGLLGTRAAKIQRSASGATDAIPTGALPHGAWTSDDNSRVYVGLESGDGMQVIDTATNKIVATVGGGQAPQALVYLSNVAPSADDKSNLVPRVNQDSENIQLKPVAGMGKGFVVVRSMGVVDALEAFLYKLKADTQYDIYSDASKTPVGSFRTNAMGMANGTMIGPEHVIGSITVKEAGGDTVLISTK